MKPTQIKLSLIISFLYTTILLLLKTKYLTSSQAFIILLLILVVTVIKTCSSSLKISNWTYKISPEEMKTRMVQKTEKELGKLKESQKFKQLFDLKEVNGKVIYVRKGFDTSNSVSSVNGSSVCIENDLSYEED